MFEMDHKKIYGTTLYIGNVDVDMVIIYLLFYYKKYISISLPFT
jgi:hypothetical protein